MHDIQKFFETSNGRLPLEHGSDRRETLAKRVSDDLQLLIFCRQNIIVIKLLEVDFLFSQSWRFGEPMRV